MPEESLSRSVSRFWCALPLRSPSHLGTWLAAASVAAWGVLAGPVPATAQDTNILHSVDYIMERLQGPLEVRDMERTRELEEDRSRRVEVVGRGDEPDMEMHWKPVARPGEGFNNEPRYELAAYRFQKLFLDEDEYVVPPTVLRAMPIDEYREYRSAEESTIPGTESVLFLLSYWIQNLAVDTVDPFDEATFEVDPVYARHFGNANILTHLINHKDGNHGNVLVSMDPETRRVFAVDNDVAFTSQPSDFEPQRWQRIRVDRLPEETIDRLRGVTREDLEEKLGVVAEFEIVDDQLEPVEPGENLGHRSGVRVTDDRVQFGLTSEEIRNLETRIRQLVRNVDRGRFEAF